MRSEHSTPRREPRPRPVAPDPGPNALDAMAQAYFVDGDADLCRVCARTIAGDVHGPVCRECLERKGLPVPIACRACGHERVAGACTNCTKARTTRRAEAA